jgi:hypothetical protein
MNVLKNDVAPDPGMQARIQIQRRKFLNLCIYTKINCLEPCKKIFENAIQSCADSDPGITIPDLS